MSSSVHEELSMAHSTAPPDCLKKLVEVDAIEQQINSTEPLHDAAATHQQKENIHQLESHHEENDHHHTSTAAHGDEDGSDKSNDLEDSYVILNKGDAKSDSGEIAAGEEEEEEKNTSSKLDQTDSIVHNALLDDAVLKNHPCDEESNVKDEAVSTSLHETIQKGETIEQGSQQADKELEHHHQHHQLSTAAVEPTQHSHSIETLHCRLEETPHTPAAASPDSPTKVDDHEVNEDELEETDPLEECFPASPIVRSSCLENLHETLDPNDSQEEVEDLVLTDEEDEEEEQVEEKQEEEHAKVDLHSQSIHPEHILSRCQQDKEEIDFMDENDDDDGPPMSHTYNADYGQSSLIVMSNCPPYFPQEVLSHSSNEVEDHEGDHKEEEEGEKLEKELSPPVEVAHHQESGAELSLTTMHDVVNDSTLPDQGHMCDTVSSHSLESNSSENNIPLKSEFADENKIITSSNVVIIDHRAGVAAAPPHGTYSGLSHLEAHDRSDENAHHHSFTLHEDYSANSGGDLETSPDLVDETAAAEQQQQQQLSREDSTEFPYNCDSRNPGGEEDAAGAIAVDDDDICVIRQSASSLESTPRLLQGDQNGAEEEEEEGNDIIHTETAAPLAEEDLLEEAEEEERNILSQWKSKPRHEEGQHKQEENFDAIQHQLADSKSPDTFKTMCILLLIILIPFLAWWFH